MIELGISSFGEATVIEGETKPIEHGQRIRNLIEEIELSDKLGLDVFAIGEHHRKDFAVSSVETVLAAAAVNTKNIKLSSATTNISTNDPVRVYQNFATVDAISKGRAEIMVGRSSFSEGFRLFGYEGSDYSELFDEKFNMLLKIRDNEILDWKGRYTQDVNKMGIYPRATQQELPIWVATGGTVESTVKVATRGLPIVYAIIGGDPLRFKQHIKIYKTIGNTEKHDLSKMKVAMHSWGYIHQDNDKAIKDYFHPTKQVVDAISKDRPNWRPLTFDQYMNEVKYGSQFVGDPKTVAQKIIRVMEGLEIDRFFLHLPVGSMKHEDVLNAINLFATETAPIVREYFNNR